MIARKGEKLLIHTSNFRKVKRVDDVVRIFHKIQEEIPTKLLMVGDGPERGKAEALTRELNIQEDVLFLGSQNAVEEIYAIGDIFLLPSGSESFGLSALEAMACGVPVIASNAGGLPEVVLHNVNGYTAPLGDVDEMADCAMKLLTDNTLWNRFSAAAEKHAQQFYLEKIIPQYESFYEEIVKKTAKFKKCESEAK